MGDGVIYKSCHLASPVVASTPTTNYNSMDTTSPLASANTLPSHTLESQHTTETAVKYAFCLHANRLENVVSTVQQRKKRFMILEFRKSFAIEDLTKCLFFEVWEMVSPFHSDIWMRMKIPF